jgi:hypothetical protein
MWNLTDRIYYCQNTRVINPPVCLLLYLSKCRTNQHIVIGKFKQNQRVQLIIKEKNRAQI